MNIPNAQNNTPCIIELDSTYRCRCENPLPGNFKVKQTVQRRQNKNRDPVSNQSPLVFFRGCNFAQNSLLVPGEFNKNNYLIVNLVKPSTISTPLPDNNLGFISEGIQLCIQAAGINSEISSQNSLHIVDNYYAGATLGIFEPNSNKIIGRRRILAYKYYDNNNSIILIDGALPIPVDIIEKMVILDPTDLSLINNPYIFCPKSPSLSNHYTHLLNVKERNPKNNTNIIYNHCKHEYRPVNSQSYLRNNHVLQILTTTSTNSTKSSGPINGWNACDIYSIRAKPPMYCGGISGEEIANSNNISDFTSNNTPLFLTTETLTSKYPPKRLEELDNKYNILGETTLYHEIFNLPYGVHCTMFDINLYPFDNINDINAGEFLEISNTRCVDISGSPTDLYKIDISDASGSGDIKNIIIGNPNSSFSKFIDFYRGCKLRFSVIKKDDNTPVFDSPFYGAIREISSYDGSMNFTINLPIIDPSFNTNDNEYTANLICDHSCFLPKLDNKIFNNTRPSAFREILSYVNLSGTFGSNTNGEYTLVCNSNEFNKLSLLYNQKPCQLNNGLKNLYIQDTSINNNNINLNMIKKVISFDKLQKTIVVTFHASGNNFGNENNTFTISSGKLKVPYNNKLGNQDLCLLNITDNFCTRINNPNNIINSTCTYEINLCNVVLPNIILDSYFGGRIAAYQYFYVALSCKANDSKISLLTNNKNVPEGAVFRVPVERQFVDETNKFFLSFSSVCPIYTKFNPVNGLSFSVVLPNGQIFKNISEETYPPCIPNPLIQISASFLLKRLDGMGISPIQSSKYTINNQSILNSRNGY